MNTKIDGLPSPAGRVSQGAAARPAPPQKEGQPSSAAADDSVRLSGGALDLVGLARSLAAEPAFDAAKVQALRTALEAGTYRIDAQEIARRLARLERELLG
ncbi:MAG: hypothetical protein KatS3mg126_2039 [Lysobacteraceae bacterium]|nr:MAG: hypothetical protein KatS3mg126_2039 [Xanthomonadaceae bacterium]